jgi:hypothetical protein
LGLLSAELNLPISIFAPSRGIAHILECDFLVIRLPGVRKDCIARNVVADEVGQTEAAISFSAEQPHTEADLER